ncbi:glycoside hydrolase family 3 N-terminal domain-containing protein [Oceanirhabdus seepicola]|uniref:Glycoside hydrolase family 3 C-terminal domain-containing protein n=1 Tax=Oceanirhabdus seepicola TaxID=2828781 RepID=A0A9J6P5A2_9CLOT|nr:glycoside hydrolase family 3 N-terminal domain-containing protein [Oceanirhabdus seepicola]MCM1991739.1 glycoside hydrolase family 3 C-terminal domain-containing protein [Oceanirhabdus seepicola]
MSENYILYKDSNRTVEERVNDLIERMILEEKVAQLGSEYLFVAVGLDGFDTEKLNAEFKHGWGQISRAAGVLDMDPKICAKLVNGVQKFLVENTRLGIPAIVHEECLCGYQAKHATAFTQSIGVASTWDPEVVEEMSDIIREQMLCVGARQGLSPVLDIARDARWGRVEETYGEDPYLVSRIGTSYIKGLQGDGLKNGVIATAKHFLGYGLSEGGMNWSPVHLADRELWGVYAKPFEAAIHEANLASVMNSYSEIDGIPCGVSKEILTDLLRDRLGFKGMVVSDYGTIETAHNYHHISEDLQGAGVQAIEAGLDVELSQTAGYGENLIDAVRKGLVSEEVIDRSVRRVLAKKFELGLFENPYGDSEKITEVFNKPKNKKVARKLACESMVLLKNQDDLLPLKKDTKSIAVIGPNADTVRNLLGDYSYVGQMEGTVEIMKSINNNSTDLELNEKQRESQEKAKEAFKAVFEAKDKDEYTYKSCNIKSILAGIKDKVSENTEIHYARGCDIMEENIEGFEQAVEAARKSEVAVVIMGGKSGLTLDSTSGESRDRADINLSGVQMELLKKIKETGTPVVLVLVNGRPLSITWESENIPAILEAWVPGEEGAGAVADVLFGDYNPGGKLPISFPRSVGQVPVYYNHKPSGGRSHWSGNYVNISTKPLYPFGYGLSYTTFEYSNLFINKAKVDVKDEVEISLDIKNIGEYSGDEVVQLYLHDRESTITRAVKELYGFKRLSLEPGEVAKITFTVPMNILGFYDRNKEFVVEPGNMDVMIGTSSEDIRLKGEFEIIGEKRDLTNDKAFFSRAKVQYL